MSDKPLLEQHILERLARCQSTDDPIGEKICEEAIVGLRWKNNSSLEEWFPFTAESIARLEAERGSLRAQVKTLREALEEINSATLTMEAAPMRRIARAAIDAARRDHG